VNKVFIVLSVLFPLTIATTTLWFKYCAKWSCYY